jgi:hypothetical protein
MPTMDEYLTRPVDVRLARLRSTPEELASLLAGRDRPALTRRPDPGSWSAAEIVCHLRDAEEAFGSRFDQILAMDVDPKLPGANPDRMAEERQYLRNDVTEAIAAFRGRRQDTLATLAKLTPAQWDKGGLHPVRGRITLDGFLTLMAWHDDNHLDQIARALEGRA